MACCGVQLREVTQNLQLALTNAATYIREKAVSRHMSAVVCCLCRLCEDAAEGGRAQRSW